MRRSGIVMALTLAVALAAPAGAARADAPVYRLARVCLAGGGGDSRGGVYTLSGTAGQPEAGNVPAVGGGYTLSGGFWGAIVASQVYLYLPVVTKDTP